MPGAAPCSMVESYVDLAPVLSIWIDLECVRRAGPRDHRMSSISSETEGFCRRPAWISLASAIQMSRSEDANSGLFLRARSSASGKVMSALGAASFGTGRCNEAVGSLCCAHAAGKMIPGRTNSSHMRRNCSALLPCIGDASIMRSRTSLSRQGVFKAESRQRVALPLEGDDMRLYIHSRWPCVTSGRPLYIVIRVPRLYGALVFVLASMRCLVRCVIL